MFDFQDILHDRGMSFLFLTNNPSKNWSLIQNKKTCDKTIDNWPGLVMILQDTYVTFITILRKRNEKGRVNRVNQVILASHGGLAAGMRDTVELIVGEVPNIHILSTTRDETEPIAVRARRLLEGFDPADAVYILTDVMGGSVNNEMITLLPEFPQATLLCGTNACLALNLASAEEVLSDGEIEEFLEEARSQIVNCNKLLRQAAENEEDDL